MSSVNPVAILISHALEAFGSTIKRQGLSIILLCMSNGYFLMRSEKLDAKYDECNSVKMQAITNQMFLNSNVIERNTNAYNLLVEKFNIDTLEIE